MARELFHILGLPVTSHGLAAGIGLLLLVLLAARPLRKRGLEPRLYETFLLFALPLCLLLARAFYVLFRLGYFLERPDGLAFRFWQGGYSLWGALAGFLLAGLLAARRHKTSAAALLDRLAPFGLLALALFRLAEGLSGQGFGQEVAPGLRFFPMAVVNEYGEWRFAIFLLSACVALACAILLYRYRPPFSGAALRLGLLMLCTAQLVLESLRQDQFLSFGFVKVSQLMGALVLLYLLVEGLMKRRSAWRAPRHSALALFALLLLLITALEFAIDKSTLNINLIYVTMALAAAGLFVLIDQAQGLKEGKR